MSSKSCDGELLQGFASPKGPEDLFLEQIGFIYLNGEITESSSLDFIKSLHRALLNDGTDKIYVFINSPGGSVGDAISIYEHIRFMSESLEKEVVTIATAEVMSAATIVLQAGHERIMTENAVMMIHEMSWESEGSKSQHEDFKAGVEMMEKIMTEIITARCNKKSKASVLNNMKRKETYLDAKKCKRLGLIDRII